MGAAHTQRPGLGAGTHAALFSAAVCSHLPQAQCPGGAMGRPRGDQRWGLCPQGAWLFAATRGWGMVRRSD